MTYEAQLQVESDLRELVQKGYLVAFLDRRRRLRYVPVERATPAQCARSLRGEPLKLAQACERAADQAHLN